MKTVPPRQFQRDDFWAAAFVAAVTFAVYVYTMAPSVTLRDSGEFITAAVHLGVPHPPGYPLWTISGFLISHLLPFGNVAWRVNLQSAIFGAVANGLLALLVSHSSRWFLLRLAPGWPEDLRRLPFWAGATSGLLLGFSDVMWSQAVIADVFTLNVLFLMLVLVCFYRWMAEPRQTVWLLGAVFSFAVGLTNHHTLLFIIPSFLVGVYLGRKGVFPSFSIGLCAVSLSALAILTWYSHDPEMEQITRKVALVVSLGICGIALRYTCRFDLRKFAAGFLVALLTGLAAHYRMGGFFALQSRSDVAYLLLFATATGLVVTAKLWQRVVFYMLGLSWAGLMIYGYMQFASATNPPMNWGYARENGGFFHAINRGQYTDNLTSVIKRFIGPYCGLENPGEAAEKPMDQIDFSVKFLLSIKLYYQSLEDNFTLPICLLIFPVFLFLRQLSRQQQRWLAFLGVAYFLLAFCQFYITPVPGLDRNSHEAFKEFFLQSHCIFVLFVGYGVMGGFVYLRESQVPLPGWSLGGLLFVTLIPLQDHVAGCNLRGHWFGWHFGVDMLRPLEKGAVVFGGTDPGRFITTYTIFCEGDQDRRWKRDPDFDRSDLYVITQNALADGYYLKYIRDHYDANYRPHTFSRLERWLGRDHQYPVQPLNLPTDEEFRTIFSDYARDNALRTKNGEVEVQGVAAVFDINGRIAKTIFEKNKREHAFYIEESFPILWTYVYALPSGLLLKLNPEPLTAIPAAVVAQDRKFWDAYTAWLISQPGLGNDLPAASSFAKLRGSIGNVYSYRKMYPEAEYAFRQALQINPGNDEVTSRLVQMLVQLRHFADARRVVEESLMADPKNDALLHYKDLIKSNEKDWNQQQDLIKSVAEQPEDLDLYRELIELSAKMQDIDTAVQYLEKMCGVKSIKVEEFLSNFDYLRKLNKTDAMIRVLNVRLTREAKDPALYYERALIYADQGKKDLTLADLTKARRLGGASFVKMMGQDKRWEEFRKQPEVDRLFAP